MAGYRISSTVRGGWHSSINNTSPGSRLVSSAARSPGFDGRTAGDAQIHTHLISHDARQVVFPRPGGPYSRTWSSGFLAALRRLDKDLSGFLLYPAQYIQKRYSGFSTCCPRGYSRSPRSYFPGPCRPASPRRNQGCPARRRPSPFLIICPRLLKPACLSAAGPAAAYSAHLLPPKDSCFRASRIRPPAAG